MEKKIKWMAAALCLAMCFSSCGFSEEAEQLFRTDTVVNIPLNPETEAVTQPPDTELAETETTPETAAPTMEETVPETTTAPSKSGGSGKSSSSSGSKNSTRATKPPETQPPVTQPPETEPPATESPEAAVYDISDYAVGGVEYAAAELINLYRAEAGVPALALDGWLCGIASVRAYEAGLSWSHTRPNGSGWQSVLTDYGCGYSAAAEELGYAAGYDAAAVVNRWMGSESNSADLLSGTYTAMGAGVYNWNGTVYLAVILIG